MSYKAENRHALSYKQHFSKQRFLDICRCAFIISRRLVLMYIIGDKNFESKLELCIESLINQFSS